ncbi:uncharacterized protein LOC131628806 [Vicia villosa]|uniref:uncharacterized protein LOC131628806 n=1 Tax=Vicia villosa TaxID=3911 RepID=UPI00273CF356|nr:uncharacterized protein LOC131628806 [Vicia villosa]
MSKELDTNLLGVVRPPSESCDERGKRPKLEEESEPELESKPESDSEPEPELESKPESDSEPEPEYIDWDYRTIPYEELVYEDFAKRFDDFPRPYFFSCSRFIYMNKAQKKQNEEEEKAVADYLRESANISPFDAIPVPPLANRRANNYPKPMTSYDYRGDRTNRLIELSKLSLEKYNDDQGSNYQFHNFVKACRRRLPLVTYYITFEAKDAATHVDPSNSPITTFQAHVWNRPPEVGPPVVQSCSIKP